MTTEKRKEERLENLMQDRKKSEIKNQHVVNV